jgi:hypothetical protein
LALIALSVMGFIDYLGYGTVFMCAMFHSVVLGQKNVFFLAKKAQYDRWEVVPSENHHNCFTEDP